MSGETYGRRIDERGAFLEGEVKMGGPKLILLWKVDCMC